MKTETIQTETHSHWLFWLLFAVTLVLGALLRYHEIEIRPFHHDEGVNWFFLNQTKSLGYYPYSHENYHGPTFFYITRFLENLIGDREIGIRSTALLCGVLITLIPVIMWKQFGKLWVLAACLLLVSSPSLAFFARYAIHESLFLLGSMLCAFCLVAWIENKNERWIFWGFVGLAILITTKETFIVTLFCLGLAWLAAMGLKPMWMFTSLAFVLAGLFSIHQGLNLELIKHPFSFIDKVENDKLFYTSLAILGILCLAMGNLQIAQNVKELWNQRKVACCGALVLIFLIVVAFTGGFFWPAGLSEMLAAIPQWWGRNDSDVGHHKFFYYYTDIFLNHEPFVLLSLALCPLVFLDWLGLHFVRAERFVIEPIYRRRLIFFSVWTLASFIAYSFIKYKTPWLVVDISLPAALLLATWIDYVFRQEQFGKVAALLSLLAILIVHTKALANTNYGEPCWPKHPYCYVHTTRGMVDLVDDINSYWAKYPSAKVLIGVNGYWPLPYYLRKKEGNLMYLNSSHFEGNSEQYDILILELSENLQPKGWAKKYYRLNPAEEAYVYFKRKE